MKTCRSTLLWLCFVSVVLFIFTVMILRHQQNKNHVKQLWVHIVYTEIKPINGRENVKYERKAVLSHGLFNQMYSLFNAVDLANLLKRELVVNDFYVHYMDTNNSAPLSKVIALSSLNVPTSDWGTTDPSPSKLAENVYDFPAEQALDILRRERTVDNLEMGCLFNFPLTERSHAKQIQQLRFHPIFYEITASFRKQYPTYQVVHFRMEHDFCSYFHRGFNFGNVEECMAYLLQQYDDAMKQHFDPNIPTLVVSHFYKDPSSNKKYALPWKNLVHFTLSAEQREKMCNHLEIPVGTTMREIDAIFDFVLSTSSNVRFFIGCGGSTFSEAIQSFWDKKNCMLVDPIKHENFSLLGMAFNIFNKGKDIIHNNKFK